MLSSITVNKTKIPIIHKPSKRRKKTIAMKVDKEGLIVYTPVRFRKSLINNLIERKKSWIYEVWKAKQLQLQNEKQYIDGELFKYLGNNYPLVINKQPGKRCKIEFNNSKFDVFLGKEIEANLESEIIQKTLNKRYREKAFEFLTQETMNLADKYKFSPDKVVVKSYKRKYGLCRGNSIYLNYNIIELPIELIHHIILHELCHLKYKNHGPNFRGLLGRLEPNYKENNKKLKTGRVD